MTDNLPALEFRSAAEPYAVRFDHASGNEFQVTVTGPECLVSNKVYHDSGDDLDSYFAELASEWRGWNGSKDWISCETHLRIGATSDRTGHVTLEVLLDDDVAWTRRILVKIVLEAGQLESLARSVGKFIDPVRGKTSTRRPAS